MILQTTCLPTPRRHRTKWCTSTCLTFDISKVEEEEMVVEGREREMWGVMEEEGC
jgi:hypothetical protein